MTTTDPQNGHTHGKKLELCYIVHEETGRLTDAELRQQGPVKPVKRGRVTALAPTPVDDKKLEWLRGAHQPEDPIPQSDGTDHTVCKECYRLWPCTISQLLVMIP